LLKIAQNCSKLLKIAQILLKIAQSIIRSLNMKSLTAITLIGVGFLASVGANTIAQQPEVRASLTKLKNLTRSASEKTANYQDKGAPKSGTSGTGTRNESQPIEVQAEVIREVIEGQEAESVTNQSNQVNQPESVKA
jgi:hypothetical protein